MNIRLETAKNASVTCVVDGRFLHSKYNPENEAKKFVDSIECNYNPSCIIVLGACLSHCFQYLNVRFPSIPLYVIQYDSFFYENKEVCAKTLSCNWDKTFVSDGTKSASLLCEELYSSIGEINVASALTISWKAADEVFVNESINAWEACRSLILKARDVIATRSYFSFRWLKNSVSFCLFSKNLFAIEKHTMPIFVVASGPTLNDTITSIKKLQEKVFILALSSALPTLIANDIIPDMCISTDGGYYAKSHLDCIGSLLKKGITVPLGITPESNVSSAILENASIVPLTYNDGIESDLLKICKIPANVIERNGSVSGSAITYALELTSNTVYIFGLDLCNGKGYNHSKFNAHELINSQYDYRLKPLSTRVGLSDVGKAENTVTSLDLYRQWFETRNKNFASRLYRVSPDSNMYDTKLGNITTMSQTELMNNFKDFQNEQKKQPTKIARESTNTKKVLCEYIESQQQCPSQEWIETCALPESIALQKYPDSSENSKKVMEKIHNCGETLKGLCL